MNGENKNTNKKEGVEGDVVNNAGQGSKKQTDLGLDENLAAALSYIWILGLVFFLVEKKSEFVRFHSLQSVIGGLVLGFLVGVLSLVPLVGCFAWVAYLVVLVYYAYEAYQGKMAKMPVIGDFVEGQVKK